MIEGGEQIHKPRVFLSCVSAQFGKDRAELKNEFADGGIQLTVQEDFTNDADPFRTLTKLYHHLAKCELVIQLIGITPPQTVDYPTVEELLRIQPSFRRWLIDKSLFVDLQSGVLGYTDFESFPTRQ